MLSDISTPFFIYDYYGKISVINSGYGASARNIKRVHVKNCKWVNIDNSNGGINVNTEYSDKIGIAIEYSTVFISGVNLTYATNVIANLYINASNVVIGSGNITSGQVFAQLVRNSTLTANNVTVSKNMDWLIVDNSANKFVYNVPPTSGSGILPRANKVFNTSLITDWSDYNGTTVSYNRIFELTPTNEKLSNPSTTMPRALLQNSVVHLNGGMLINGALTNEEVILTVPEFMKPRYYKTFQASLFNSDNSKSRPVTCLLSGDGTIKIYGDVNNIEYNKIYFDVAYTLY